MSHKIQAMLELARQYQLPNWFYQSLPILDPYSLASVGYQPSAPLELECHVCHHKVTIPQQPQAQKESLENDIYKHEENCIYQGEKPWHLTKEDLYDSMEQIYGELNENSTAEEYPLLKTSSIWKAAGLNSYLLKKTEKYLISFFLRLFGWQFVKKEGKSHALTCHFCGQVRQLSELATTENTHQHPELEDKTQEAKLFDPIEQHRYFCLWTGPSENWLILLQDLEDKHFEYVAFNFKSRVQPLSMKKMKVTIDKYLESFNEKIENSLSKMKQVSEEFDKVVGELEKQQAELDQENVENSKKRLRDLCEGAERVSDMLKESPRKKVKGE